MSSFRFWETDIRAVRKINRSTIRRKNTLNKNSWVLKDIVLWHYSEMKRRPIYNGENRLFFAEALSRVICTFLKTLTPHYCTGHIKNLNHLYHYLARLPLILPVLLVSMFSARYDDLLPRSKNLESTLEQALKEAVDDATLRKIKRISYSANAATEVINFHC